MLWFFPGDHRPSAPCPTGRLMPQSGRIACSAAPLVGGLQGAARRRSRDGRRGDRGPFGQLRAGQRGRERRGHQRQARPGSGRYKAPLGGSGRERSRRRVPERGERAVRAGRDARPEEDPGGACPAAALLRFRPPAAGRLPVRGAPPRGYGSSLQLRTVGAPVCSSGYGSSSPRPGRPRSPLPALHDAALPLASGREAPGPAQRRRAGAAGIRLCPQLGGEK